jgi:four helix bundle protein
MTITTTRSSATILSSNEKREGTNYRGLVVWQRAMDLVVEIYRCAKRFPREEVFGLTSQMRRASIWVPSNISEGKGPYCRELVQFLFNARGSLTELQTQITLAERLGYLGETDRVDLEGRAAEVDRLLNGMIARFRNKVPVK